MAMNFNVATAPKDTTFQVRINSEIKKAVEDIYTKAGMTLIYVYSWQPACKCLPASKTSEIFQELAEI